MKIFNFTIDFEKKTADILLFGEIGSEIRANEFVDQIFGLEKEGIDKFNIFINSIGGDVFEGFTIYNALKGRNATIYIYSVAASIASFVAMAGKKVYMSKNAFMMIHNPWTIAIGDSEEFKKTQTQLERIKVTIMDAYRERTKADEPTLRSWMDNTTWFSSSEAMQLGFIDGIQDAKTSEPTVYNRFKTYINNTVENKFKTILNIPNGDGKMKFSPEFLKKLGLDENATEADIEKAVEKLEVAAPPEPPSPPAPKESDSQPTKALLARIEALEVDRKAEADKDAETLIDMAIADGKILPADKDAYVIFAKSDFTETKKKLDARAKNSALPGKTNIPGGDNDPEKKMTSTQKAAEHFKASGRAPLVTKK